MSYPPSQMVNRWENRSEPKPGQGQLYWHVLFKDEPRLQALASSAQEKLAPFAGLHLTPRQWLHLTVMPAGFSEDFTDASINEMIARADQLLSGISPITVTFGEIWYHPEAIVLGIKPVRPLDPLLKAVRNATKSARGQGSADDDGSWTPHVTLAYSTAVQAADPIIATLGHELPGCDVTIRQVNLVVQQGPERLWNWRPIAKVSLSREHRCS